MKDGLGGNLNVRSSWNPFRSWFQKITMKVVWANPYFHINPENSTFWNLNTKQEADINWANRSFNDYFLIEIPEIEENP